MREAANNYCIRTYGYGIEDDNVFEIPVGYADSVIGEHDVQVYFDLVNNILYRELAGIIIDEVGGITKEDWDDFDEEFLTLGDWSCLQRREQE